MATKERIQNGFLPKGPFTLPCWVAYTLFWVLKYLWTILPSQPAPTKMNLKLNLYVLNDLLIPLCSSSTSEPAWLSRPSDWVPFSSHFLWCLLRSSISSLSSYSLQQWNFSDSKVSVVADVAKLWIKRSHAKPRWKYAPKIPWLHNQATKGKFGDGDH